MTNRLISIAGVLGALGVMLGALGAHAFKPLLSFEQLGSFKTGVTYHLFHTFVLLAIALSNKAETKLLSRASLFFLAGIILFSGSIYILSTNPLHGMENISWLGPITPIGGICLITGWIFIALFGIKPKNSDF